MISLQKILVLTDFSECSKEALTYATDLADKFGSSVATALRVQSDSMRTKRRQIAEEKAAKTAVKLILKNM